MCHDFLESYWWQWFVGYSGGSDFVGGWATVLLVYWVSNVVPAILCFGRWCWKLLVVVVVSDGGGHKLFG